MARKRKFRAKKKSKDKSQDKRLTTIERIIGSPELKQVNFHINQGTAMTTTISSTIINQIVQDTISNNVTVRNGNRIQALGWQLNHYAQNTAEDSNHLYRVMVFWVNGDANVLPSDAAIMISAQPYGNLNYSASVRPKKKHVGGNNLKSKNYLTVLYDSGPIALTPRSRDATQTMWATGNHHVIKASGKLNKSIVFDGAGATDYSSGSLIISRIAESADVTNGWDMTLWWTDV